MALTTTFRNLHRCSLSWRGVGSPVPALKTTPLECLWHHFAAFLQHGRPLKDHPDAGMLWRWQQTARGWRYRHSCAGACMRSTAAMTLRPCRGLLQGSSRARSYGAMF